MPSRNERITQLFATAQSTLQRRVARAVNTDPETIEDACSHAWQQLITHPDVRLDTDREPLTWLTRVAINEAISRHRRRDHGDELHQDPSLRERAAGQRVEDAVLGRARLRALRPLPERQRILILLQGAGYSYQEIAEMTGHSTRAVDRHLRRAQRNLHAHDPDRTPE